MDGAITSLVQVLLSGVLNGGIYALMALSLSLIFGVMRIVNVAHGEVILLGAYITYWLFTLWGIDPFLGVFMVASIMFIIGMLLERTLVETLFARSGRLSPAVRQRNTLVAFFGLALLLENTYLLLWTANYRSTVTAYATDTANVAGVVIPLARVYSLITAILVAVILYLFLLKTRTGKAIRAVTQNKDLAKTVGIKVEYVSLITFGLGFAVAAVSGTLFSMLFAFQPSQGRLYTLKTFSIVVLGGLGSVTGVILGGFTLALIENLFAFYFLGIYKDVVSFMALILVLMFRPTGLFGKVGRY